jgi:hypothetical protein
MALELTKLAGQGRAFSPSRPWEAEELDALLSLERDRGLSRLTAADYVRNGIMSVEDYDKAQKKNFTPKTLDEATSEMEVGLKGRGAAVVKKVKKVKKVK